MSTLTEWWDYVYRTQLSLTSIEGGTKFSQRMAEFPLHDSIGDHRAKKFLALKFKLSLSSAGYTTSVFSVNGSGSTNFAYAYWRSGHESEFPEYVCVADAPDAVNGEYRSQFMLGSELQSYYESIATAAEPIELSIMGSTKYTVNINTYPIEK